MSTQRYIVGARKDKEGKPICKVCSARLTGRRRSYCNDECFARNRPDWMRSLVYARDKGICALCSLDTKIPRWPGDRPRWEADHIIPVSEGGGLCGLDGYRTLCWICHGRVSGDLRKRLNARKRIEKIQRETGKLF